MSVANILFLEDRILCLSDTMVYVGGEAAGLCDTKCWVHPSGTFAMVTRGLTDVGDAIQEFLSGQAQDLTEAEKLMPRLLDMACEVKANGKPEIRIEATLMGWSQLHRDLRAIQFRMNKGADSWGVAVLDRGLYLHPEPGVKVPPPSRNFESAMVKLALAQRAVLDKHSFRDMCIGGVMHLTTITGAGIAQAIVGTYPDYDRDAERFGDPNAASVAAFRTGARKAA